jgi:hypothetical protein
MEKNVEKFQHAVTWRYGDFEHLTKEALVKLYNSYPPSQISLLSAKVLQPPDVCDVDRMTWKGVTNPWRVIGLPSVEKEKGESRY